MEKGAEYSYNNPNEYDEAPPPPYSQVANNVNANNISAVTAPALPKKKIIGCFGARTWTQIIASVQIFMSLSGLLKWSTLPASYDMDVSTETTDYEPYTDYVSSKKYQMFHCFLSLLLGLGLLAGSHMRKPVLILAWLIGSAIALTLSIMLLLLLLVGLAYGGGLPLLGLIALVLLGCAFQYFCYSIVFIHRQEMILELELNTFQDQNNFDQFHTVQVIVPEKNSSFPYI